MAKKRNKNAVDGNVLFTAGETNAITGNDVSVKAVNSHGTETETEKEKSFLSGLGRGERIAAIGVCLLMVVGALGATGLGERIGSVFTSKNSSSKANQSSSTTRNSSTLASLNPFAFDPTPTPLPLSKEYIYAGSRMLAVEDAAATALPPADLAVWRPSSGYWYVLGGTGSQQTFYQWGQLDDKPVPGDYDGDGKTDFAVYRPSNYNWHIILSSTGAYSGFVLGSSSGDLPAPADYDGDGKTDIAVFQSGSWTIRYSSTGSSVSASFGQANDKAVPADFDGDGKADLAVWRVTNGSGYFHYKRSTQPGAASLSQQLGQTGDKPVVGDFDGDGASDIAVYRESSSSSWYVSYSANNYATYTSFGFGQTGDIVVHNDYDGDGKVDIAVWRNSTGVWYIRQSSLIGQSNEVRQQQWGATGDTPVPAFYRR
jgi:hypothetical protein